MKTARNTFKFVGPLLARIEANRKRLTPLSADLPRRALKFQIELRVLLLKDVGLVRGCLRPPNGVGYRYCGYPRRRRRFGRSSLHRTKLALAMGGDWKVKIAQRSQTVNPNELP